MISTKLNQYALTSQQPGSLAATVGHIPGQLLSFINLLVNDEDIRQLQGLDTPIKESDRLILIPSIAGG